MAEAALKETEVDTPVTPEAEQSKPERGDRLNLRPSTGPKNTQDLIRAAIKEVREKESPAKKAAAPEIKDEPAKAPKAQSVENRDESGRFVAKDKPDTEPVAQTPATGSPPVPATAEVAPQPDTQASKPTVGAPTSWSQEAKAQWASLPPAIQAAVLKREDEASKGFKEKSEQLNRYQAIEQVMAPVRSAYQTAGVRSDAEAVSRLLQWENMIRANPAQGIAQLARSFGISLQSPAQTPIQYGQDQPESDQPPAYLNPLLSQVTALDQRFNTLWSRLEQDNNARVAQEISAFSQGKPHFDRVKANMGHLMKAAAESGNPIDLQTAYDQAVWANPDVRTEILAEQEAERTKKATEAASKAAKDSEEKRKAEEAKRAAEAEAKRKASISPRGSTPSGKATARKPHSQSIRDTILAARKETEDRA